jgi:subtilisin family serine protease
LPPLRIEAAYAALSETVDWGLAAYSVPAQWTTTRGAGIRVAVLDTGIEADHPDLADAIDDCRDFSASRLGSRDRQGHGTHVAGTIAARANGTGVIGVAPECRLLVGKVLGDDGSGTSESVAAGIDWAVAQRADILSLSLGSPTPSEAIRAAIERAVAAGRFVICAAGNEGRDDAINYPARWPTTISVGAVDRDGRVARFSSRGAELDICAPGQDVLSTFLGSGYARLSGTSMATPFVTGVVALALAKHRAVHSDSPIRNTDDLRAHLQRSATDAGPAGRDPAYGFGLINPAALLADIQPGRPLADLPAPVPAPIPGDTDGVTIFIPHARVVA